MDSVVIDSGIGIISFRQDFRYFSSRGDDPVIPCPHVCGFLEGFNQSGILKAAQSTLGR